MSGARRQLREHSDETGKAYLFTYDGANWIQAHMFHENELEADARR